MTKGRYSATGLKGHRLKRAARMILCFNVMKIKNEINIVNKILPQVFGLLVLSCPEKIFVNSVPSCVWRVAWEDGETGDMKPGHVVPCCPLIGEYFFITVAVVCTCCPVIGQQLCKQKQLSLQHKLLDLK